MRGSRSVPIVLAAALAAAALAFPAAAQCPSARTFGGDGGGMFEPKLNILTNGTENAGNEIGYFWENGLPSNDSVGGGGVGCPSSAWWVFAGPDRRVNGAIATPTCQMDVCPAPGAVMNLVVEDATADGADAAFIMFQVDETPPAFRWWDHARVAPGYTPGAGGASAVNLERFPSVDVTAVVAIPGQGIELFNNYANLALNYHGVQGAAHTPTPASTGIAAYDILGHMAATGPTRARGSWNLGVLAQVPYSDEEVIGHIMAIPFPDLPQKIYLGVGVEFVDGVKSALVGRHLIVNPNVADPDDVKPLLRPKTRVPD